MTTVAYTAGEVNENCEPGSVLVVSPFLKDHGVVRAALGGTAWHVSVARDFAEAMDVLDTERITIVICDTDQRAGDWRELLRALKDGEEPPSFILASARPDEYLWAEVLNLGGFDVLPKPFDPGEIARVLASARNELMRQSARRAG